MFSDLPGRYNPLITSFFFHEKEAFLDELPEPS